MAVRSITTRPTVSPEALRRTLPFGVTAVRLATSVIQSLMPNRQTKLTHAEAAQLVEADDLDAIIVFQWASLASQDDRINQKDVSDVVSAELRAKRVTVHDYVEPILSGLEEAGLIERRQLQDASEEGAADGPAGPWSGRPSGDA
jgi:hypothetical protein